MLGVFKSLTWHLKLGIECVCIVFEIVFNNIPSRLNSSSKCKSGSTEPVEFASCGCTIKVELLTV